MKKPAVAFVVQRYGPDITGGSEAACRQIAERLTASYDVEVLTTRAADHLTWKNVYPEGVEELNGVRIRRFSVDGERQLLPFHEIYDRIFQTHLGPEQEREMIRRQGPDCPALIEYIRRSLDRYGAFVFFTYLYYPTVHGLPLVKSKAVFVPTVHDEQSLYVHILDGLFQQTPHIVCNTEEERHLLRRRFNLPENVARVIGFGVERPAPEPPDPRWTPLCRSLDGKRVLTYIGRVENGKGCDELVDFFMRFLKESGGSDLVLLLIGRRTLAIPSHPQIVSLGFVSEYVKQQALARTDVLVAPSPFESFGLAALEGLLYERPILVNGRCDVLVGHCVRSNGGLWYGSYDEFAGALERLLSDAPLRAALGRQGRAYVERCYRWPVVEQAYREVLDRILSAAPHSPERPLERQGPAMPK